MVLGVSLGGHAAWQCVLHDPRVTTAIVIIGCPDYVALMSDRARLSKLQSWAQSNGSQFLGSKDFPPSLTEMVETFDPAGLFLGACSRSNDVYKEVSAVDEKLSHLMNALHGKRILSMSGGSDGLVPYKCSQPFIRWFQRAVQPGGWFEGAITFEDIVYDGVGHEMSPGMATKASQFVNDSLELRFDRAPQRESKI